MDGDTNCVVISVPAGRVPCPRRDSGVGMSSGVGLDDIAKLTFKGINLSKALPHAAKQVGVTGGISGSVAYISHEYLGFDFDTALLLGNLSSIPAGMLAKRLFPCFPAGTPILTATGWKPIEEIEAGDVVLSRDETDVNAPVGPQEVQEAHQREGEILTLTVNGKEINTTTEHPFWVKDKGWVEAFDLKVGYELSTTDNRWIPIDNIQRDGTITTVYNMTVRNWHTYFIGTPDWGFDVWVHNNHSNDLADLNLKGWKTGKGSAPSHQIHAEEMGYTSVAQYTNAAKEFQKATGDNFITAKVGNHFYKYDKVTENLLIVNGKDRVIKTFYNTDNGLTGFKEAMQSHINVLRSQGHDL